MTLAPSSPCPAAHRRCRARDAEHRTDCGIGRGGTARVRERRLRVKRRWLQFEASSTSLARRSMRRRDVFARSSFLFASVSCNARAASRARSTLSDTRIARSWASLMSDIGCLSGAGGAVWPMKMRLHYETPGDTCVTIEVPEHGNLSEASSNSGWTCERGYRAEGETVCGDPGSSERLFVRCIPTDPDGSAIGGIAPHRAIA